MKVGVTGHNLKGNLSRTIPPNFGSNWPVIPHVPEEFFKMPKRNLTMTMDTNNINIYKW